MQKEANFAGKKVTFLILDYFFEFECLSVHGNLSQVRISSCLFFFFQNQGRNKLKLQKISYRFR